MRHDTPSAVIHQAYRRLQWPGELGIVLLALLALAALYGAEAISSGPIRASSAKEPTPAFSAPGGYYDHDLRLELNAGEPGAAVVFTLDGRAPTMTVGAVYTQPIRLSADAAGVTVVRARGVSADGAWGPVVSASYVMGLKATLPVMSLIVEPDDLWGAERGIYANPEARGVAWERPVDVTYVDEDRRAGFHVPAGVRIHGHWSRAFDKKSLRLYFRQEYGVNRLDYPMFAGSPVRSFKRLVLHAGGEDWNVFDNTNWTLLRNQLTARLAFQMGGYAARDRPVLLFLNGEPWGIYQVRERLDRYFLADHLGVESADLLQAPEYYTGGTVVTGDRAGWDRLTHFVETHDLADPAHYAYVQTQVDIPAFIDYNLLQIYTANIDWPEDNIQQFRPRVQGGRWHWMMWDNDRGYGMYQHSSVNANIVKQILDYDSPQTSGRDVLLLRRLIENPAFRTRFLARAADLLNTVLAPEAVTAHIDALAAELEPDIAFETVRWSSSTNWESNIEELRDFARRRPGFVRQHIVKRFDLAGMAQLTFNPPAGGAGRVAVNGALLPGLPWQGIYFQGVPVQVMAAPAPGYRFAGWDGADLPQTPAITLTVDVSRTLTPRFEPISADAPQLGDVLIGEYGVDDTGWIEGDWFKLEVKRPGGVDLRGWRVTDNDTKTATDEGSLIFDDPAWARVPFGVTILVVASETAANAVRFGQDDLDAWDGQMTVYVGNGHLDATADPWFNLGARDNLVLLAPGPGRALKDDQGIAFISWTTAVTPASFGVLADGVLDGQPEIRTPSEINQ